MRRLWYDAGCGCCSNRIVGMTECTIGVWAVERDSGEELGGHAAAAARVVGVARCARASGTRFAKLLEQI